MKRRPLLAAAVLVLCAAWSAPPAGAQAMTEPLFPEDVDLWVNRANVEFRVYKNEAAIYEFGPDLAKPYFWPLEASNSKQVTRSWPMMPPSPGGSRDRPEQKSAWFGHGDVIPEGPTIKRKRRGGRGIDFWGEGPDCGRIACVGTDGGHNDENRAWVTTYNEWRTANGDKVMDEVRKIQFFNYTTARLFVVDIDLVASVGPVTFGDTEEGGFAVRVADGIAETSGLGRITNAEGKAGEKECRGRLSAWCDYSGTVEDEPVGIALFAGPDNPSPTRWNCRRYGLLAANPFARARPASLADTDKKSRENLVRLDKGKHLKLRYGLFVHLGDVKQGKVAEGYELFKKIK
jgi:hypothetical protein